MAENETASIICSSPVVSLFPTNDTAVLINDMILCIVNVPCCIFAFLGNLAIIIAVVKTPSLQRPSTILLCGLAAADCLTGLVAQPLFVLRSLMIYRIHESCVQESTIFIAYDTSQVGFVGWSLVNITLISFDRHYGLSKPLKYRANVTKKGEFLVVVVVVVVVVVIYLMWHHT